MRGWLAYSADLERPSLSIALSLREAQKIDIFLKAKRLTQGILECELHRHKVDSKVIII